MNIAPHFFISAAVTILLTSRLALADNLVANSSAEQVAANGAPEGWGLYVGAGQMKFTASPEEKHSGERSACLELTDWHTPKDAADAEANRSVSGAILLAPNNGYSAAGAMECEPGTTYVFSFWYRGSVTSASVSVTGWPSAEADHTQRVHHAVTGGTLRPNSAWQRCTGTFRIQDGVRRFAVMIHASGKERDGFTLGKFYVDDAEIKAKDYPDGELRGIWCGLPKAQKREEGLREIQGTLDRLKACGFNTLFVWTSSLYLAALDRPQLQEADPQAAWDALGEVIRATTERQLQVHVWYSPWVYKQASRAVELRDHPDWAAVSAKGTTDKEGICFARPEVRQFELDLLGKLIDRYPDLAGIHIEEPGYNWGADYCYCDHCQELCRQWFGLDLRKDPDAAKPVLHNLAAFMGTDFVTRLRQLMMAQRPELWLSANGSGGDNPDWYIGRDWTTWARRGYLDFYVPQLYTQSPETFAQQAAKTKGRLGDCDLVTGMAVSWSGIYPERQDPKMIQAEIAAARKLDAKGFVVFHLDHFQDGHFQAIRESLPSGLPEWLSFVPEMKSVPEMNDPKAAARWSDAEKAAHADDIGRATAEWNKRIPEIKARLSPERVRSLSRWAKAQMEQYQTVPALEKVDLMPIGFGANTEKLLLEGTIDTLPTHNPLVTRWLKVLLVYDPREQSIFRVTITIRGQVLE